jgi:DNA-binding transcriptional MerR regulator
MKELPKLYTLPEVAAALGLSPHTIRAFVRQGKLSPLRICRRLLFDPEELAKMIRDAREPLESIASEVGESIVLVSESSAESAAINCT